MKLNRIIEDLSDSSTEIQVLALTTIPRMSADFPIVKEELEQLVAKVTKLAASENPDVVFLARKALNVLGSRVAAARVAEDPRPVPQAAPAQRPAGAVPKDVAPMPVLPTLSPAPPAGPKAAPPAPPALPTLLADLAKASEPSQVATLLTSVLGHKDPSVLPAVEPFLNHSNPRVRANAIEVYGALGDRGCIPLLLPLLNDENNRVRSNVAMTLGRFGVPAVRECLVGMLESEKVSMRESALYAISGLPQMELLPHLEPLVTDPYEGVRRRLVDHLATVRTDQATELLRRLVADRDAAIRDRAVAALVSRGVPVEGILAEASRAAEALEESAEGAPAPEPLPPTPLDETVELGFRTTLAEILRELRLAERRGRLARLLYQAGIAGFQLCRRGEFKLPEAMELYYEVEKYQEFLRDYSQSLRARGTAQNALAEQIVVTGLAQYEGRLKASIIKLGRLLVTAAKAGHVDPPADIKALVTEL